MNGSPNLCAFLDTIATSEIGATLLAASDNGYNVLVGGMLFEGYDDHPRKLVWLPRLNISSTAAGRYQLLARYFDSYKALLGLQDFSPASQDAIAVQQIRECRALPMVEAGDIVAALGRCAHIWASLPGAGYGQHENNLAGLETAYVNAGGVLA